MIELPDNWNEMNDREKMTWFAMYYLSYDREGEFGALQEFATDEIRHEYNLLIQKTNKIR